MAGRRSGVLPSVSAIRSSKVRVGPMRQGPSDGLRGVLVADPVQLGIGVVSPEACACYIPKGRVGDVAIVWIISSGRSRYGQGGVIESSCVVESSHPDVISRPGHHNHGMHCGETALIGE